MRIYIMRHGETDANKEHRICGWTESELDEAGIEMAAQTGRGMKEAGIKFDAAFTSPLVRAKLTCYEVLQNSGNADTPAYIDERLQEVYAGEWDGAYEPGYGYDTVIEPVRYQVYFDDPLRFACFPGGEPFTEGMKRSQTFLNWLSRQDYENVLVTTHGCLMMCMIQFLRDNPAQFWPDAGGLPKNCSVNIVETGEDGLKLIETDKLYYK